LPFSIPYGTLVNYSPRGSSDLSKQSRDICGAFKAGRPNVMNRLPEALSREQSNCLQPFLNEDVILVPIPRSSLLQPEQLWPALEISKQLLNHGYGSSILKCVERINTIRKSSQSGRNRPSVTEQLESLGTITPSLESNPLTITLIDDVLTMGRTSIACALKVKELFPNATIRLFAPIRTQGLITDISSLYDPSIGNITYNNNTGYVTREP